MKKKLLLFGGFLIVSICFFLNKDQELNNNNIVYLRKQHKEFLNNSPFKETLKLSKEERKAKRLTPNKFYERLWELTMNPSTGKPEP